MSLILLVDIWSVACIMAEMITGQVLFPGKDPIQHVQLFLEVVGTPDEETLNKMISKDVQIPLSPLFSLLMDNRITLFAIIFRAWISSSQCLTNAGKTSLLCFQEQEMTVSYFKYFYSFSNFLLNFGSFWYLILLHPY